MISLWKGKGLLREALYEENNMPVYNSGIALHWHALSRSSIGTNGNHER